MKLVPRRVSAQRRVNDVIITTLVLLAGGLIGASNIIIAKRPNAKDVIDKLVPFQGIIGVVLLLWGLKGVFDILRTLNFIHFAPFWWPVRPEILRRKQLPRSRFVGPC